MAPIDPSDTGDPSNTERDAGSKRPWLAPVIIALVITALALALMLWFPLGYRSAFDPPPAPAMTDPTTDRR